MADALRMVPSLTEEGIGDYPAEKLYVPWGMVASIAFHLSIMGLILWLAYLSHIRSLRDMMTASIAAQPPDQLEILLLDEKKEPPPTDNPLWIKQIIIPKVKPPPPPPPPKPKPKPKQPAVVRVAPQIRSGDDLPQPHYPIEAYRSRIQGTVILHIAFDGNGTVVTASVVSSSGSAILDNGARNDILENWRDKKKYAGESDDVPIRFQLK